MSQLRGSLIKFIGPGATQIPFPESAAIVTNHRVMSRDPRDNVTRPRVSEEEEQEAILCYSVTGTVKRSIYPDTRVISISV